jgi:hypothetical protein
MSWIDPGDSRDLPAKRKSRPDTEVLSLFDEPKANSEALPPYQPASSTSKDAARKIAPHSGAMRENVLNAIIASGEKGATRKELESVTGYLTQTLCARLYELEELGEIQKSTRSHNGEEIVLRREGCAIYLRKAA